MRRMILAVAIANAILVAPAFGQAMTEFGAAAAGGSIGAAGGKGVSNGINSIFGRMGQTMDKAAKSGEPAMKVAPGVPKQSGGVPEPPPPTAAISVNRTPVHRSPELGRLAVQIPYPIGKLSDALPAEPLPPPPTMTPDELKTVTAGMSRADVLALGLPSMKMTMVENGHLVESYSYRANGDRFGGVKITDGVVSAVQVQ